MVKKNTVANKLKNLKKLKVQKKNESTLVIDNNNPRSFFDKYTNQDITFEPEQNLWNELNQLKEIASITFIEIGKRLTELQKRYANNKTGSFQKIYLEKGWKKTEVQTLIIKYNEFLKFQDNSRDATELNKIALKIENSSQKTMAEFKKAPLEVKEMYINDEINGANEIKQATNKLAAKIKALDVKGLNEFDSLEEELKFLEKDIKEREKNLRKIKKSREELLSKIKELNKEVI